MKKYQTPVADITVISVSDIITASGELTYIEEGGIGDVVTW